MAQQLSQSPVQAGQKFGQEAGQTSQHSMQTGQQQVQQAGQQVRPQAQMGVGTQAGSTLERPSIKPYEETMPSEFRVALHDSTALAEVSDWCKDKYVAKGPEGATVKRTLEDLRDIANLNARFITHDSEYGPYVAEAFLNVASKSISELQTYQQDPVIAETVPVIKRAVESTQKLLRSISQESQVGGSQISQQSRFGQQLQGQTSQVGQQTGQVGGQFQTGQSSHVGQQSQTGQTSQVSQRKYGQSSGITR